MGPRASNLSATATVSPFAKAIDSGSANKTTTVDLDDDEDTPTEPDSADELPASLPPTPKLVPVSVSMPATPVSHEEAQALLPDEVASVRALMPDLLAPTQASLVPMSADFEFVSSPGQLRAARELRAVFETSAKDAEKAAAEAAAAEARAVAQEIHPFCG